MKIRTAPKQETLTELLAREAAEGYDEPFIGSISEMYSDPTSLKSFGFDQAIQARAAALASAVGDEDPQFVVVRTEEGWSESGRLYDGAFLESIAEQVAFKEPVAHLGHIPEDQLPTAFPEPQTTWFGALTRTEESQDRTLDGKRVKVIYTVGYNLPGAKIRMLLKAKAVNSTSWQGYATSTTPIPGKGVKVDGIDLQSIDWARKGSEGMKTSRVITLAREMKEGRTRMEGNEKDLAQVTPDEYKEACPNGYTLLVREIGAEKDAEIEGLTTQVQAAAADKTLLDELRGVLKLDPDADLLTHIGSLMKKLGEKAKAAVDDVLDTVLKERVPDEETRKLVRRLVPVQEMVDAAKDASDTEAVTKLVSEMVDKAFDEDDVIQTYVSEMDAPNVRRREELERNGKSGDYSKLGMTKTTVGLGG